MKTSFRVKRDPVLIKIRVAASNLPQEASVKVTDLMLQPGRAVSGWLPHTTELPWAAGIVGAAPPQGA